MREWLHIWFGRHECDHTGGWACRTVVTQVGEWSQRCLGRQESGDKGGWAGMRVIT